MVKKVMMDRLPDGYRVLPQATTVHPAVQRKGVTKMANTIKDIVILNDTSSINGEVLVKQFKLKLPYDGTIPLAKARILAIELKHPPHPDTDEVQVDAGTRLYGDLSPSVIPVRLADTTVVVTIPKADIHTLIFFTAKGKVSAATRKALKTVA